MDISNHLITVFLGYFAIMNPIANTAIFVSLTSDFSSEEKEKIARKSILLTFLIIVVFAILGKIIFHFFGITISALRLTGGILVFIIAYQMLHGQGSNLHKGNLDANMEDISVSPLAVPLLAGPGTIATTMSFSALDGWFGILSTILAFAILCVITFVSFMFGDKILKFLGQNGLQIVTRLMGLILAIIGVQMFIQGVYGAIKSYLGV